MKIAILLETSFSGGGSFTHSINASQNIKKHLKNHEVKVYTNIKKNFQILNKLNLNTILFKFNLFDKIILKLSIFKLFRSIIKFLNIKTSLEKNLINNGTDIVYFPVLSNTVFSLKNINFFSTFLDLEHFRHSIFPEIDKYEFERREKLYFYALKRSYLITVSHKIIKKKMCKHYGLNSKKVIIIPYSPSSLFKKSKKLNHVKKLKNIKNYFFYPAQIWGHKNHISIIKAAYLLKKFNKNINFIFSGRDRGYKSELEKYINQKKIKNVHFVGYLDNNEMDYAYKNCIGVIFTSLFGPDAIPPLEAWSYKKPLIYNNKFKKDVPSNSAILVNVKNPELISEAIVKIFTKKYNNNNLLNGLKRLKKIKKDSEKGYKDLNKKIDIFLNK